MLDKIKRYAGKKVVLRGDSTILRNVMITGGDAVSQLNGPRHNTLAEAGSHPKDRSRLYSFD